MKLKILAGILIAGMLALLLWPNPVLPFSGPPEQWKDGLHAPFFALVTILIFILTPRSLKPSTRVLTAGIAALALSPLTEAIQPIFNRSASFGDLIANTIGICVAVSGIWIYVYRKNGLGLKITHAVISALLLLAFFTPAILKMRAHAWHADRFPDLSSFDDRRARFFWVPQGNAMAKISSGTLGVSTTSGHWSGVSLFPPKGSRDWSGYKVLTLEFENPGETFRLGVRIDDPGVNSLNPLRDSYEGSLSLEKGRSTHRIPVEDIAGLREKFPFDVTEIIRLALFLAPDDPPRVFFIKRAFLE